MDEAYRQHSHHSRRKNRSTTNLNHLTLAPLTSKLPLDDEAYTVEDADYPPPQHTTSYLQGKSAPTTPGILSRSPGHSRTRSGRRSSVPHVHFPLPKSKSASHLAPADLKLQTRKTISGTSTPTHTRRHKKSDDVPGDQDADWLLRAGVLMSTEAREYKGQMWLASRASSTSLAGMRDAEEDLLEREFERERELLFRNGSRRGSIGDGIDGRRSAKPSRAGSRSASRAGSRSQLYTPVEGGRLSEDGYFARSPTAAGDDEYIQGPDFVNLDEKLEAIEQDTSQDDEAAIRKLVRGEMAGRGSWFRWPLFSVEEQDDSDVDDDDDDDDDELAADVAEAQGRRGSSIRHFEGVTNAPKEHIPPPDPQQGGWQDAAWLLSVASRVIL